MSDKNYLLDNINFLMNNLGLTANLLSKETGIAQTTIYKIKDGVIANPTIDTISQIAKRFGVSIDELLSTKIEHIVPDNTYSKTTIPLIALNDADKFPNADIINYINTNYQDIIGKFCVEILNDYSIFGKNAILIIDQNIKHESFDYVIVKKNNSSLISIKQAIFDDRLFLKSTTIGLEYQLFSIDDYTILGTVIGHIKYFKGSN